MSSAVIVVTVSTWNISVTERPTVMTNPTRTVVSNYYDGEIDESDEYKCDGEADCDDESDENCGK